MLIIGIILGNLAVLVVGKSQFVILCTVDDTLLDSRIYLAKSPLAPPAAPNAFTISTLAGLCCTRIFLPFKSSGVRIGDFP